MYSSELYFKTKGGAFPGFANRIHFIEYLVAAFNIFFYNTVGDQMRIDISFIIITPVSFTGIHPAKSKRKFCRNQPPFVLPHLHSKMFKY